MRGLQRINLCPRRTEDGLQRPFPWSGIRNAVGIGLAVMGCAGFRPLELILGGHDEKSLNSSTFDLACPAIYRSGNPSLCRS